MDKRLEIFSAGTDPAPEVNPAAIAVMKESGITIRECSPAHVNNYLGIEFDYLITVGDGTQETLRIPPLKYKRKMHLGFANPFTRHSNQNQIMDNCREIRDEIFVELDYFYHRMLKPSFENS